MRRFTIYDAATGRIKRTGGCQSGMVQAQAMPGEIAIEGSYPGATHWFDNGTPALRPQIGLPETHIIAAETDWTITGIPDGTEVLTDGESLGSVTGGEVTLTFPQAGLWRVALRPPFPWRDATCEVTVT